MQQLAHLSSIDTKITEAGVAELKKALPKCDIIDPQSRHGLILPIRKHLNVTNHQMHYGAAGHDWPDGSNVHIVERHRRGLKSER